jgi:hypothetical protein
MLSSSWGVVNYGKCLLGFTVTQPAILIKKKHFFIKKRRAEDGKTSLANQASSIIGDPNLRAICRIMMSEAHAPLELTKLRWD